MHLEVFNAMSATQARAVVAVWADVPRWVEAVVAGRPYATLTDLERTAAAAARSWTADEVGAALAHHPRIGQPPPGRDAREAASRHEQAAMGAAPADVAEAIARGNRDYERRFGRVFLVRAAGRSPADILAQLTRRLANGPAAEEAEVAEELRQIALVRLRSSVGPARGPTPEAAPPPTPQEVP